MLGRIVFIISTIIFRIVLDAIYIVYVSEHYDYLGFIYAPSPSALFLSYLMLMITSSIVPLSLTLPSKFMTAFLYLVSYVPATTLMAIGGFPFLPTFWLTLALLFLCYLSRTNVHLRPVYLPFARGKNYFILFVTILFIGALVSLLISFGYRFPALDFDVYVARAEFTESLAEGNPLVGYVLIWQGSIIAPFLAVWAAMNRKIIILVLVILSQFYVFAIGGHKSLLLSIFFGFWTYIGVRYFRDRLIMYLIASFLMMSGLSAAADYALFGTPIVTSNLTQRLFFTPASLYYFYYDFFRSEPMTLLAQNIVFRWISEYTYDMPIPNLIGSIYYSSQEASANANMWADAYASFGVVGMFLYTFLLWLIMKVIDAASYRKNPSFVYVLIAMPLFSLTNTGLPTALLSFGMLFSIILILLLPNFIQTRERLYK